MPEVTNTGKQFERELDDMFRGGQETEETEEESNEKDQSSEGSPCEEENDAEEE